MFGVDALAAGGRVGARGLLAQAGRFSRFAVVGASGVLVNNAILYLLVERAHWAPVIASVVATEAAIVSNFTFNDLWTFADMKSGRRWLSRAVHYNVVVLGGLLVAVLTLLLLTSWLHVHYLIANLAGIAAGMVWNYTVNLHITWRKPNPAQVPDELWQKAQ